MREQGRTDMTNKNERPVEVPRLVLTTEEERKEWEAAQERTRIRKERRKAEKEAGIY